MKSIQEIREDIKQAIKDRETLKSEMVGNLYPHIVSGEMFCLRQALAALPQPEQKSLLAQKSETKAT